jgi:hypothetical protein
VVCSHPLGSLSNFYGRLCSISGLLHSITCNPVDVETLAAKSMELKTVMNNGMQNIFNQQQSPLTPGRVITKIKRYTSPSGQVSEMQCVTVTLQDNQGIWRTEEVVELKRPLDDGITVTDCDQIRECVRCKSLIHVVNSYLCPSCSLCYCLPCTENIKTEDQKVRVCANCAKEARTPAFINLLHKVIWG